MEKIKEFIAGVLMTGLIAGITYCFMIAVGASDELDEAIIAYRDSHW